MTQNRPYGLCIDVSIGRVDLLVHILFEAGAGALREEQEGARATLTAHAATHDERERLKRAVVAWAETTNTRVEVRETYEGDRSWATSWMQHLAQEPLGESFVLQPLRDDTPAPADRTRLWYEPRLAFGAGSHPTTRLAAAAVEVECRRRPGCRLLDAGTGNGVLAMIGVSSGASAALGIDVDSECVAAARHNAVLNGLHQCRFTQASIAAVAGSFDVVVANIEEPILLGLAGILGRRVARGGSVIATGFLEDRAAIARRVFEAEALVADGSATLEGWGLCRLKRDGVRP